MTAFVRATPLAKVDPTAHLTGSAGPSAVCLSPLVGDAYAPHLRTFAAYYRALGFSLFYPYLLDPGPATLAVLRELALEDGVNPIRWGLPQAWTGETSDWQRSHRQFAVEVDEWDLPGMEMLAAEVEFELGTSRFKDADVKLWYYGQSAALQDCSFRAMAAGARWVAAVDFDEWLVLVPPGSTAWPASSSLARPDKPDSRLADWMRQVPIEPWYPHVLELDTADHLGLPFLPPPVDSDRLSAGYLFKSAFVCAMCEPSYAGRLGDEDWPLVLGAPVRHEHFLAQGVRSKTVFDPWAWYTIGIHMPGMSFAEYAATVGYCSDSRFEQRASPGDVACVEKLVDTFGYDVVVVKEFEPFGKAKPTVGDAKRARGAMLHLRVPMGQGESASGWVTEAGPDGVSHVSFSFAALKRVKESEWEAEYDTKGDLGSDVKRVRLIEDYTAWEVMRAALSRSLRLMDDTSRKRQRGRRRGWSLLALTTVVGLASAGWYKWRKERRKSQGTGVIWSLAEMRSQGESPTLNRAGGFSPQVSVEMRKRPSEQGLPWSGPMRT